MAWFNDPISQANGVNNEEGVDIATPFHTPITALFGGIVKEAQRTLWPNGLSSGGIVVLESNIPGVGVEDTYYLHLDTTNVQPGQTVQAGQQIGLSGGQTSGGNWPANTIYSSGPHTEFGIGANDLFYGGNFTPVGSHIDPTNIINAARGGTLNTGSGPNSDPCGPMPSDFWTNYSSASAWLSCKVAHGINGPSSSGSLIQDGINNATGGATALLQNIVNWFKTINWQAFLFRTGFILGGAIVVILGLYLFIKDA